VSRPNKYSISALRQRVLDPKHQQHGGVTPGAIDTQYGMLSGMQPEDVTIYVNPLRAQPSVLKADNTRPGRGETPTQPMIEWTEEAREAGALLFKTMDMTCLDKYPSIKPHADLMWDRLEFHKRSFQGVFEQPIIMVAKSLLFGPQFTNDYLSELKLARFQWLNMKFSIEPTNTTKMSLSDYSSAYLGYHFIFWKEDVNDYEAMFGGVPESDPEILQEIEQQCAVLSETLMSEEELCEEVPLDYIYRPVSTGGFTGEETCPEWSIEFDSPEWDIDEEIMVCARSIAPKRPGEVRDIGIMKPSSLHFHRKFMYYLQKACNKIPGCPYGRDSNYLKSVVRRLGRRNDFFYMRDYTKSGMTIPHDVQAAVLRGFFARRPELGRKAARFYRDQQLYFKEDDGSYRLERPQTGSPLGMFVEGYTIFQYALHEVNMSHIDVPYNVIKFTATNDDMVAGSQDKFSLQVYQDADERNNSALGMSYKDTKSGISDYRFVYCEEYWIDDHIDPKTALMAVTLVGAKQCFNAFHAKEYCIGVMMASEEISDPIINALHEVQAVVGYEFHEDEFNWPYLFGGWLPQIKKGLDWSIDWYNGDLRSIAAYWANRVRLTKKGKMDSEPHLTIGRKLGIKLLQEPDDPDHWLDLVPFFGTKRTLERHYRSALKHPKSVHNEYHLLARLRWEKYNNIVFNGWDSPSIYEGWLRRHPNSYIPDNLPMLEVSDPYTRIPGPRMGVKQRSFLHKLLAMRKKGFIDFDGHGVVSATTIKIAESGFQDLSSYKYLPVSEKGFSALVLEEHLKGYIDFYERTNKVIIRYDEKDYSLQETKLWGWMPWASLLTTMRMYKKGLSFFKTSLLNRNQLSVCAEMHRKISHIEYTLQYQTDEEFLDTVGPTEASDLIGELVRDVIRDWETNPDDIISQMRDRIITRPDRDKVDPDILMKLNMIRSDEVSLFPGGNPLAESNTESRDDSDISSVFEDPWAELGVT
jgi:hypothetical protein